MGPDRIGLNEKRPEGIVPDSTGWDRTRLEWVLTGRDEIGPAVIKSYRIRQNGIGPDWQGLMGQHQMDRIGQIGIRPEWDQMSRTNPDGTFWNMTRWNGTEGWDQTGMDWMGRSVPD
jgi:hypothetical protein